MIASILLKEKLKGNVVTVFADDNKKYLSTDLSKPIDNNKEFISNQIELIKWVINTSIYFYRWIKSIKEFDI